MNTNELQHGNFKYIRRIWKNGRWNYTYENDKTWKSNKGTIEAYQKHGNKHSRNMPGSSATEANTGKGMTRLQRAQAMAKGTGNTKEWDKITDQHARYLRKNETGHEHNIKGSSRNTKPYQEFNKKFGEDRWTLMTPKQTTKKQIRQGIRRAKVKTLKREFAEAIDKAKKWIVKAADNVFDANTTVTNARTGKKTTYVKKSNISQKRASQTKTKKKR